MDGCRWVGLRVPLLLPFSARVSELRRLRGSARDSPHVTLRAFPASAVRCLLCALPLRFRSPKVLK